jgi:hypothetical protein
MIVLKQQVWCVCVLEFEVVSARHLENGVISPRSVFFPRKDTLFCNVERRFEIEDFAILSLVRRIV